MNLASRFVIFAFVVAVAGSAHAAIISYDYEFDTPTYTASWAGPLNAALSAVGPTITGSLSFDTDNGFQVVGGGTINSYSDFIHTSELMSLAGFSAPTGLYVFASDGVTPENLFYFNLPGSTPFLTLDLFFPGSRSGAELNALCFDFDDPETACDGTDFASEDVRLTNFSLVRTSVPLPATLALFALGFAGLVGFNRRKHK